MQIHYGNISDIASLLLSQIVLFCILIQHKWSEYDKLLSMGLILEVLCMINFLVTVNLAFLCVVYLFCILIQFRWSECDKLPL